MNRKKEKWENNLIIILIIINLINNLNKKEKLSNNLDGSMFIMFA